MNDRKRSIQHRLPKVLEGTVVSVYYDAVIPYKRFADLEFSRYRALHLWALKQLWKFAARGDGYCWF